MTTTTRTRTRRTAIRADRLFDGTRVVDEPLVLIEDGRITAVDGGTRVTAPSDAELVGLPGATLLPGLVDTHVHLAFDAGPDPVAALAARDDAAALAAMADAAAAQLRAGVTTVRDLGDRGYLALRLPAAATGPLPTIVAAGPPITCPGGHCHFLGAVAEGVAGVRAAVREHVERGVGVIKVMASGGELTPGTDVTAAAYTTEELRALVDEAHRHGLPVTAHAHGTAAIRQAVDAGVDGIEHCAFRTADGVHAPADLVAAIVARRIAVGTTLGVQPPDGSAPARLRAGSIGAELARLAAAGAGPPAGLVRDLPAILAAHARLCRAGAVLVAGTDAGIAPVKPHGVLPVGLAQLADLGLDNAGALRAGTVTAAAVCGLGDRKGRVAPGYDADLLAVDGDPLTDLDALRRPVHVIAGGRAVAGSATGVAR